jgi:hypothetical protein
MFKILYHIDKWYKFNSPETNIKRKIEFYFEILWIFFCFFLKGILNRDRYSQNAIVLRWNAVALRRHTWFEFTPQLQSDVVAPSTTSAILRPHQVMRSAISNLATYYIFNLHLLLLGLIKWLISSACLEWIVWKNSSLIFDVNNFLSGFTYLVATGVISLIIR